MFTCPFLFQTCVAQLYHKLQCCTGSAMSDCIVKRTAALLGNNPGVRSLGAVGELSCLLQHTGRAERNTSLQDLLTLDRYKWVRNRVFQSHGGGNINACKAGVD